MVLEAVLRNSDSSIYHTFGTIIGALIQIDHACVRLDTGLFVKYFKATHSITYISYEHVYFQATSKNATHFLSYIKDQFLFPILSIQIDEGPEFIGNMDYLNSMHPRLRLKNSDYFTIKFALIRLYII